ncbi:MAG: hypothetical protein MUF80_00075 [Burkholderiales bacterium]|nr:hypothetical protein [Burkholderiales bacterium]
MNLSNVAGARSPANRGRGGDPWRGEPLLAVELARPGERRATFSALLPLSVVWSRTSPLVTAWTDALAELPELRDDASRWVDVARAMICRALYTRSEWQAARSEAGALLSVARLAFSDACVSEDGASLSCPGAEAMTLAYGCGAAGIRAEVAEEQGAPIGWRVFAMPGFGPEAITRGRELWAATVRRSARAELMGTLEAWDAAGRLAKEPGAFEQRGAVEAAAAACSAALVDVLYQEAGALAEPVSAADSAGLRECWRRLVAEGDVFADFVRAVGVDVEGELLRRMGEPE